MVNLLVSNGALLSTQLKLNETEIRYGAKPDKGGPGKGILEVHPEDADTVMAMLAADGVPFKVIRIKN